MNSTEALPVKERDKQNSNDPVPVVTIPEADPVLVTETVDIDMEEEDIIPDSEVEELPAGFFHSTESFPEEVSAAPDQHTAGVSMTRQLPGTNQPGSSGIDGRQDHSSPSRRRSRSSTPEPSTSGSRHSSMKRYLRSTKKESSRRDHSREAEVRIPGFASEATRRQSGSTTIRDRLFSPDRRRYCSFPCSERARRSPSCDRRRSRRDSRERRRDSRDRSDRDHTRHRRDSSRHH